MKVLILLCFFIISFVYSFSIGNMVSFSLDFVPGVSSVKGLYEVYSGKDLVTEEDLSNTNRVFGLLSILPFGNYLKIRKHLKNAEKFSKAAKRAKDIGKIRNSIKFIKASVRAMKKAEVVPKTIRYTTRIIKALFS